MMYQLCVNYGQIFDAVIVLTSFALDVVFVEGVGHTQGEEAIALLIIFLLWRILRVVNGNTSTALYCYRPHRSTTCLDAACCYRPSSVVRRSVCYSSEPCKNGQTDRDAAWVEDSGWPNELCMRWGVRSSMERGNVEGRRGGPL